MTAKNRPLKSQCLLRSETHGILQCGRRLGVFLLFMLAVTNPLSAQNVSISSDGSVPNSNAMLDVKNSAIGNGKGLLIPRMTEAQRTSANASLAGGLLDDNGKLRGGEAAQGLLVYQTDGTEGFYYNTSTGTTPSWTYLGAGSGSVTSITASSPLTGGTITASGSIGIDKASASTDGYLDNADFSNFSSAYTATSAATNTSTASTIVKRDGSGNFSAGTISANLTGNVTGNLTGNVTGNVTGNADTATTATTATNVSGTVAVANGGTGATDAATARTNLGLGSIATQASTSVDIDGGAVDGVTIGANSAGTGTFTSVTASESNAYYLGTDKVLHKGNGAMTGNLIVGNGGESLSHTAGSEGYYNTFIGFDVGRNCTTGKNNTAGGYFALRSDTTGYSNTAFGYDALKSNTTGNMNTAFGDSTLASNSSGQHNTAIGQHSLYSNTDGNSNTAVGESALSDNTGGDNNVAVGLQALTGNTSGGNNVAMGTNVMSSNTSGNNNVAIGESTLYFNSSGHYNTMVGSGAFFMNTASGNTGYGYQAGMMNSSGTQNTFCGYQAGNANTTGSGNTVIGYDADVSSNNLSNAMALGNGASVDASNKVVIGNSSVTTIGGYAVWSNYSDRREKRDITDCKIGLEFVEKLRPVNYRYNNQNKLRNGFIAQEVEDVCEETGVEFGGLIKPQTENGRYMLAYGDFVVPLVNAVKELKAENNKLAAENRALKVSLESELAKLKKEVKSLREGMGAAR